MSVPTDWNHRKSFLSALFRILPTSTALLPLIAALSFTSSSAQVDNQLESPGEDKLEYVADLLNVRTEDGVDVTTLTTNVKLTQGTMEIFGDTAELRSSTDGSGLEEVTVYGHPANFRYVAVESGTVTEGHSVSIVFNTSNLDGVRIITLSQNVNISQQGSEIFGDTAEILENPVNNEIEKVSVHGQPARYLQVSENSEETTTGSSDSIFYTLVNDTIVELVGNAEFTQPNSSINCASVIYYPDESVASGTGVCRGATIKPDQQ